MPSIRHELEISTWKKGKYASIQFLSFASSYCYFIYRWQVADLQEYCKDFLEWVWHFYFYSVSGPGAFYYKITAVLPEQDYCMHLPLLLELMFDWCASLIEFFYKVWTGKRGELWTQHVSYLPTNYVRIRGGKKILYLLMTDCLWITTPRQRRKTMNRRTNTTPAITPGKKRYMFLHEWIMEKFIPL